MAISSYPLILILNVGESVGKPPPVMALDMFPIAFGKFFGTHYVYPVGSFYGL